MGKKVKSRKQQRYEGKEILSGKTAAAPLKSSGDPFSDTKVVPRTLPRGSDIVSSLQNTRAYVLGDLKQAAIITVIMFVLLVIAYFIMR